MLTRLRVKGFKNLHEVNLYLGPFTCVAGPNGVGKSNLFDAILLLGALAAKPVLDALLSVRGTNGRMSEIGRLFSSGTADTIASMEFVADMIVPRSVRDDFDREGTPTATFLEYTVQLCFDPSRPGGDKDPVYIGHEALKAKSSSDALRWLPFHPDPAWIKRHVIGPGRRTSPFISTEPGTDGSGLGIKLFGERTKKGGRPSTVPAGKSPQTVLCGVNAVTHPTALAVRNEMRSWRMLQLEPSALRRPDELHGHTRVSAIGEHLPTALLRIGAHTSIAHRLGELIPGVLAVEVETDNARQTRTLLVTLKDRKAYSASSLSDGTLRFLALAILAADPDVTGLICMEEPENGIHPERIPAVLDLVRTLAEEQDGLDGAKEVSQELKQVLINTHSPLVVELLPDDSLLVAEMLRLRGRDFVNFKPLPETWRAEVGKLSGGGLVGRGELMRALGRNQSPLSSKATGRKKLVAHHLVDADTPDLFSTP